MHHGILLRTCTIKIVTAYVTMRVFNDQLSSLLGQNLRFCLYKGEYRPMKIGILAYFMECIEKGNVFLLSNSLILISLFSIIIERSKMMLQKLKYFAF